MTTQDMLNTLIAEGRRQHGAKFDLSDLAPQFVPYLRNASVRLTVEHPIFGRRSGWIGKTTGWRPAFLLMRRINAHGSSDVLGAEDKIVSVKAYRP